LHREFVIIGNVIKKKYIVKTSGTKPKFISMTQLKVFFITYTSTFGVGPL